MLVFLWEYKEPRKSSLGEVIIVAQSAKIQFQFRKLQDYGLIHKHTKTHWFNLIPHGEDTKERGAFLL